MMFVQRAPCVFGSLLLWVVCAATSTAQSGSPEQTAMLVSNLAGRQVDIVLDAGPLEVRAWDTDRVELVNQPARFDVSSPRLQALQDVVRLVGRVQPGSKALLMVPAGAPVRIGLATGALELKGLAGLIDARVRDGDLTASDWRGAGSLETSSGAMYVELAELTPGRPVKLRSYTGTIALRLPLAPASGRVLAVSLAGHVQVPPTFQQRAGRLYEAVFGRGDPAVSLDTVRGDIVVTHGER